MYQQGQRCGVYLLEKLHFDVVSQKEEYVSHPKEQKK
jgi:hypothetical protein